MSPIFLSEDKNIVSFMSTEIDNVSKIIKH